MNRMYIFIFYLLLIGTAITNAQDLVILRDGTIIEAKVTEISQTDIKYMCFDHLDGPVIVIPRTQVLVIRYENGTDQVISPGSSQQNIQTASNTTAIDPDKFTFAFNLNPAGFISSLGPSLCLEFGKGQFNTEINLFFLFLSSLYDYGFGGLVTFNYFGHSRIGGIYIGGGLGFIYAGHETIKYHITDYETVGYYDSLAVSLGLNAGYKFVTQSGVYFRTGGFFGAAIEYSGHQNVNVFLKPDLTIGYCF